MKKISIMTLLLVVAMVFTGCSNDEMKLYNAFQKAQKVTSMESDTDITFTLDTEGFSQQEQENINQVKAMLKDGNISWHQKTVQNEEKTIAKAKVDADFNFGGMGINTNIWVDMDTSGKTPKLVEVIKIPAIAMASAPPEYQNKEYLVYNFNEIMDMNPAQTMDYNKLMTISKELQPQFTEFLKSYGKQFNFGAKVVEYKGKESVDGENLSVYELKLDDRSFKKFIRYSANNLLENKDGIKLLKAYMNNVVDVIDTEDLDKEDAKEEIEKGLNELQDNMPKVKEKVNQFMDAFDDVKLLGDKGTVIEYKINEDGYIVSEKGAIDLNIDLGAIEKAFEKIDNQKDGEQKATTVKKIGVIKIGLNYNTNIYNINKELEIEKPALTLENTVYLSDFIKSTMQPPQPMEESQPLQELEEAQPVQQ